MATKYVMKKNVASATIIDPLRAELGFVWNFNEEGNLILQNDFRSNKLDSAKTDVSDAVTNTNNLFPEKTHSIKIVGYESEFRDHGQWRDFIEKTIVPNQSFEDLYFTYDNNFNFEHQIYNNYHHPSYEDATKTYDTNLLLNLSIMNYKYNGPAPGTPEPESADAIPRFAIPMAAGMWTKFHGGTVAPQQYRNVVPSSTQSIRNIYDYSNNYSIYLQ